MEKKETGRSRLKTTDPDTYRLLPSEASLSLFSFSQPVIQRSVVQATALATVPARAQ